MPSKEEEFKEAVNFIQNLPKEGPYQPTNDTKLKFYGWYKQATIGKCNTSRPGMFSPIERAKWDAWNKLGDMTKEEAMELYVIEFRLVQAAAEAAIQK